MGGPSYRVKLITDSSLQNPEFAAAALEEFIANRTGIMTATAADFLGKLTKIYSSNMESLG